MLTADPVDNPVDDLASAGRRAPSRAPRAMAWIALAASAAAVLAIGLVATIAVMASAGSRAEPIPATFWLALGLGAIATCGSLAVRSVRWMFLLRRADLRVPLRDAAIAYASGFSLMFVPLLAGEIALRSYIQRSRARVPVSTTSVVNLWERCLDVLALALIVLVSVGWGGLRGGLTGLPLSALLAPVLLMTVRAVRQLLLSMMVTVSNTVTRRLVADDPGTRLASVAALADHRPWLAALGASLFAWALPALGLWWMAVSLSADVSFAAAQYAYAAAALSGGLLLAPGGVRIVGALLMTFLTGHRLSTADAAIVVLAVRLVTAGLTTLLGGIFVFVHARSRSVPRDAHFDEIAHVYDAQIPAAQREALLARKTLLMQRALAERADDGSGRLGLDVGCGQGRHLIRMRELGFDVRGIDSSPRQVRVAERNVGATGLVSEGSALSIPAADDVFDFAYCINVLHHLASAQEQRQAMAEILRVVRPGGLLFVHEINTRNLLFRLYMGYVFPSLNCIDEGVERWLLPHRLQQYTDALVVRTEHFTFTPEFLPAPILRLCRPIEALLEASPLAVYSAHFMAVIEKPTSAERSGKRSRA